METLLMKVEVIREGWAEGVGEDRAQFEPLEVGMDECMYVSWATSGQERKRSLTKETKSEWR